MEIKGISAWWFLFSLCIRNKVHVLLKITGSSGMGPRAKWRRSEIANLGNGKNANWVNRVVTIMSSYWGSVELIGCKLR